MIIAGIGARQTPTKVLAGIEAMARMLCRENETNRLRTGGAHGADAAFEKGFGVDTEVFVPWYGFNRRVRGVVNCQAVPKFGMAMELAEQLHPAWDRCSRGAKALHARNCFVMLGRELDEPVDAVICWTPGGRVTGGTGQSIRLAHHFGIPVYNLYCYDSYKESDLWPYFLEYEFAVASWEPQLSQI